MPFCRCRSHSNYRFSCVVFGLTAALLALLPAVTSAQLPQTRINSIFPPGAKAGSTVELQITNGTDLDELAELHFNHEGIKAVPKMQDVNGEQKPVANTFMVTVADSVPVGLYDVRAKGLFGLSNPRTFVVSRRDEILENDGNNQPDQAQEISLGQIVNGRANGGKDLDWYRITGTKGQRIIVNCRGRRIDSQIDATIEVVDERGRRLAYGRQDLRGDPLVDVTLPEEGTYYIKVHDFLYGGGNEYIYRLSVSSSPHIDFVMPPAGVPGSTGQFTLYGRNLPGGTDSGMEVDGRPLEQLTVEITLPNDPAGSETIVNPSPAEAAMDAFSYVLSTPEGDSNPVSIYFSSEPVAMEEEPNGESAQSQTVAIPGAVAGQFGKRGDIDHFNFQAQAKETLFVEVFADRMGSSADPYLVLEQITVDKDGNESVKRLTALDDDGTNLAGNLFDTRSEDVVYRFQVPADGTYRISLRDRYFESRGDATLTYLLSVRRQRPDFRVVVVPRGPNVNNNQGATTWAAGLRKGDNVSAGVYAFRRDGFDGPIEVSVHGLPTGVACPGAIIGAESNSAELIFTAAEDAPEWAGLIRILAKSRIEDPAKNEAVVQRENELKSAKETLPKLEETARKADETLRVEQEALAKAQESANAKPEDQKLADAVRNAEQKVAAATQAKSTADEALATAQQKVAQAEVALNQAIKERDAAARQVEYEARTGTVVWNGSNQAPSVARLSKGFGLSVLKEQAPFQVTSDVTRLEVHQGRQILLPVKLAKRDGFDNNVRLTFTGLPKNSNIQVPNVQINKGQNEQLLRLFVNNNGRIGAYTIYMTAQGQVSYRRNLPRVERAKADQAEADEALKQAQEKLNQANKDRDASNKVVADAEAALKQAQSAKTEAEKKVQAATEALKQADDENKPTVEEELKKVQAELQSATEQLAKSEADLKSATAAKSQAEGIVKQADAAFKDTQNRKKAADAESKSANDAAKPRNINYIPPSTPLLLVVKPAPANLSASVPGGGKLKRGEKIDVKVTVKRINGFEGPLTLSLPLPPNVSGLTATETTIAADQSEAVFTVEAAADATEGQLENLVIRGTSDFDGKAAVDVPIKINVSK